MISEEQLETWEKRGPQESSKNTYNRIKNLLESHDDLKKYQFNIFLQGSYGNNMNIYGNSDVDIIVCLTSMFTRDISKLSSTEEKEYLKNFSTSEIKLSVFKNDVISVLKSRYDVEIKNKCLKISGTPLSADVVVSNEYRKYHSYSIYNRKDYDEGIIFYSLKGEKIISYPQLHYENGVTKNSKSQKNFKKTVRIFKNIKSKLVNDKVLSSKTAPSYFIECLIYNVPNENFVNNRQQRVLNVFSWLTNNISENLVCQNGKKYLFGATDEQWNMSNCLEFILASFKVFEDD